MLAQRILRGACAQPLARPRLKTAVRHARSRHIPVTRVFTTTRILLRDEAQARTVQHEIERKESKVATVEGVKPETVQKEKTVAPANHDSLLSEQTVSNKEQRHADWAIIKDMVQYLWPKNDFGTRSRVGLSVVLLVGAKVNICSFNGFPRTVLLIVIPGPQCTSALLLQKHCRFHEHRFCCCWRYSSLGGRGNHSCM